MKIAYIFRENWEIEYIEKALGNAHDIRFISSIDELSAEDAGQIEVISLFIKTQLTKEVLDRFPELKMIAVRATGFDHVDLDTCRQRNITVSNVPDYGQHTVAEFTFAILLTLSRKTYESYKRVAETGSFSPDGLRGFDLHGKTLGVIGTGKIGLNVIGIAQGFGMKVLAFDPFPKDQLAQEKGFFYCSLTELLQQSHVITLHAPYNEHTHHLINTENIEQIQQGSYLINTARGGLIETRALVQALESQRLAGAALDVLEEEGTIGDEVGLLEAVHPRAETLQTLLSNHYLIDHPRVLITPHNAFNTHEALRRILDTTVSNIQSFSEGQPENTVL